MLRRISLARAFHSYTGRLSFASRPDTSHSQPRTSYKAFHHEADQSAESQRPRPIPGPMETGGPPHEPAFLARNLEYSVTKMYGIQTAKDVVPLRILFCGSDEFSCESLRTLYNEHVKSPGRIVSIDVVVRPAKPTGRGLKEMREGTCSWTSSHVHD